MKRAALLAFVLATSTVAAGPAAAYVRYTSESGKMFRWPQTCVEVVAYTADLVDMMPAAEIMADVNASAATWSNSTKPCTYLNIIVTESAQPTPHAINDGRNAVIFRNATQWCHLNAKDECEAIPYYEPAALALTSVSATTSSGVIRDADIEVNAYNFSWADLVLHPELRGMLVHDLENALTHEMGHLIGLDHTCYGEGPAPLDQNGNPIPNCANASADVLATTMFPSANPGDVDKRSLAPDDQQALCDIYPLAQDPKSCAPPAPRDGCAACALAGAPTPAAGILVIAVAGLLAWRRRRRATRF